MCQTTEKHQITVICSFSIWHSRKRATWTVSPVLINKHSVNEGIPSLYKYQCDSNDTLDSGHPDYTIPESTNKLDNHIDIVFVLHTLGFAKQAKNPRLSLYKRVYIKKFGILNEHVRLLLISA